MKQLGALRAELGVGECVALNGFLNRNIRGEKRLLGAKVSWREVKGQNAYRELIDLVTGNVAGAGVCTT